MLVSVEGEGLPGVREPTLVTGMGLRTPAGDPARLAETILHVLDHPRRYRRDPAQIASWFSSERAAEQYEEIFLALLRRR